MQFVSLLSVFISVHPWFILSGMKLSEMKQVLAERGIQLTKSLGQNFLHDANQLRRIVAAADLKPTDHVLEIGPGLGPLTELLVAQAGEVLAIEKDARLAQVLEERFNLGSAAGLSTPGSTGFHVGAQADAAFGAPALAGLRAGQVTNRSEKTLTPKPAKAGAPSPGRPNLRLVHDDALEYLRREPRDWSGWKLVANLPYSVASPILTELAQGPRGPERMVATLQIEVAKRLMAGPGEKDYGVLTLLVQLDYEPRGWFKIPASCFFPEPEVDSACVCLARRSRPLLPPDQRETFACLVKRSFSQRRKMMLKLLREKWGQEKLGSAFERLALSPQTRAETVGLESFVNLAKLLDGKGPGRCGRLTRPHPPKNCA